MTVTRRLTAILAADVAGYSRLMGADEEGTHERLRAHLGALVEPKISQHRGRHGAAPSRVQVPLPLGQRRDPTPPIHRRAGDR
jgi:class 3 adenylate cyclase